MRRANTIKCDGFTLVELLMVIMIMGALASIAVPRYAAYRAKANRAQCEANRYHIEMEERAHYLDHGSPSLLIDNIYKCPSGGTYVWLVMDPGDPDYPKIGCSVHYIGEKEWVAAPQEPVKPVVPEGPPATEEPPQENLADKAAAAQATQELIDYVTGLDLDKGVENSMVSKLTGALESIQQGGGASAVSDLENVIQFIQAQRGKHIPVNEASALISKARGIIDIIPSGS